MLKIRRKSIEVIFCIALDFYKIYKLFNDRIITYRALRTQFEIYSYKEGELSRIYFFDLYEEKSRYPYITEICGLNKEEFVIFYYTDWKFFGQNAYLQFYNRLSITNKLKLGDLEGKNESYMFLIDQNNLIVELNKKLILIDTKNAIIKNEFRFQNFYIGGHDFILLNK